MVKTTQKQQKSDMRNVGVLANYAQIDETWKPYGYSGLQLQNTNQLGEFVGPSGYKIQIQKKKTGDPFVRVVMPASQPFIPFEAVDDVVIGLGKRLADTFPELKKQNFKIDWMKRKISSKGNTVHWLVQTNQEDVITKSRVKDDRLKLGFAIRNGYNTGVVLGIDIFTFRLVCSNGAIAKGQDLAQTAIRHVGKDPKALLKTFEEGLMLAVADWQTVISDYKRMAETRLNESMANFLAQANKWTPEKYFPEYYNFPTPEEKKKEQLVTLTNEGKSVTLWDSFNDMTQKLWHAQDPHTETNAKGKEIKKDGIAFKGIAKKEKYLHESMRYILNNPERFV
jgi:Domain of unknown function (DUF932).